MSEAGAKPGTQKGAKAMRDFHEEERLGRAYDAQLLRRLWPFMRPHQKYFWIAMLLILLAAGLNLVRPLVMGGLVANAQHADAGGLLRYGLLLSAEM
ncbi:MAG TPA: hypothetical protein VN914_05340, partial [Polyangia bacterium]|nr:hypothetical protein [Polyangia bacterium]